MQENLANGLEARGLRIACVVCADGGTAIRRNMQGDYELLWSNMTPGAAIFPILQAVQEKIPGTAFGAEIDGV